MSAGKFGKLLVSQGLVQEAQLKAATDLSRAKDLRLGTALVQLGHINENVLASFLAKLYGLNAVSLEGVTVPENVREMVPRHLCERHTIVPLGFEENKIIVAMADPTNVAAIDDVRFLCSMDVAVFVSTETGIKALIDKTYSKFGDDGSRLIETKIDMTEVADSTDATAVFRSSEDEVQVEQEGADNVKPAIKLMNLIFMEAIKQKASDIHLEPYRDELRVRFRLDGRLHEVMKIPNELKVTIPARIKVMASLDISEKRLPQDGRLRVKTKATNMDVRVSVLPTIYGEKVVMRLLDSGTSTPTLEKLGFEPDQLELFRRACKLPFGLILVTGPTGSGKSTSLYGALSELNSPRVNISTVEDPVEYKMTGMNQVQVKENIGLSFAAALRAFLRQDPDVIMVGEIRDAETAEISVKAALTGHLVLSTLHTNDAPSTVSRLIHMGVEPFLITASLVLVQAQRLLRVICPKCAEVDPDATPEALRLAEVPPDKIGTFKPMRGKGCDYCQKTGYKGREGIFEVMAMNEEIRALVAKGANSDQIKQQAIASGMTTLRQGALNKLYRGRTTLEEVLFNSRGDKEFGKL